MRFFVSGSSCIGTCSMVAHLVTSNVMKRSSFSVLSSMMGGLLMGKFCDKAGLPGITDSENIRAISIPSFVISLFSQLPLNYLECRDKALERSASDALLSTLLTMSFLTCLKWYYEYKDAHQSGSNIPTRNISKRH